MVAVERKFNWRFVLNWKFVALNKHGKREWFDLPSWGGMLNGTCQTNSGHVDWENLVVYLRRHLYWKTRNVLVKLNAFLQNCLNFWVSELRERCNFIFSQFWSSLFSTKKITTVVGFQNLKFCQHVCQTKSAPFAFLWSQIIWGTREKSGT